MNELLQMLTLAGVFYIIANLEKGSWLGILFGFASAIVSIGGSISFLIELMLGAAG